jgi:cyclic pyranopterin phosphate synthase
MACCSRSTRPLRAAGLQRVTVSLDSLDPAVFARMAGGPRQRPPTCWKASPRRSAPDCRPIKINAVVQRGVNDHTVLDLVEHFRGTASCVRFIEYMDVGNRNDWHRRASVVPSRSCCNASARAGRWRARCRSIRGEVARATPSRWRRRAGLHLLGHPAVLRRLQRARLSSNGVLYTCLFATEGTGPARADARGASDEELLQLIGGLGAARRPLQRNARQSRARGVQHVEMNYVGRLSAACREAALAPRAAA